MTIVEMEYLEHGKFFRNNQTPSDFYDLAYTAGTSRFSKDLRDAIGLDLKTPFSESSGGTSYAFIPVLGRSRYAFVQFQSRFENEFRGSTTNRPFFQTKFLMYDITGWRSLYENGLSVLPSLAQQQNRSQDLLDTFSSVIGSVGKSKAIKIFDSDTNNNLFFQYSQSHKNEILSRITAIANAVLEYKETGGVSVQHDTSLSDYDKLVIIDAVMHTLLPIIQEPISFALNPACTVKVNLRFGGSVQNRGAAFNLDFSSSTWSREESDMSDLVDIFAESTSQWNEQHKKIYSGFPKVVYLREKRREKEALLFLVAELKGKYSKLFQNTNGVYDDEIIPLMSSGDYRDVLQNGLEDIRVRLLSNPLVQKLDVGNWFGLLVIAPLGSTRLKNIISQYIERNVARFDDICVYFGKLSQDKIDFFTIDDEQNVFYDSIKKFSQKEAKSVQQPISETDTQAEQKTNRIISVLDGIKKLPSGYDQTEEMWSWIGMSIVNLYSQGEVVSDCFRQLRLDVRSYPHLFYKALSSMRVSLEELNEADVHWIDTFADKGIPEFLQIKKRLTPKSAFNKEYEETSQYSSRSSTPGSVNVLEQARHEQALREHESRKQRPTSDKKEAVPPKKKDKPIVQRKKIFSREPQATPQTEKMVVTNDTPDNVEHYEEVMPVSVWILGLLTVVACLLLGAFLWIADWLNHLHRFR